MKRPLACFGFTLFTVLLCLNLFESTAVSVSLLSLGAVLFILSLIFKKSRQTLTVPTVFCGIVVACLLFFGFQNNYEKTIAHTGDGVPVSGVIAERPTFSRENCRYYCVIKTETIGDSKVKTKMRLSFSETYDGINPSELEIGDAVNFSGTVYKIGTYSDSTRYNFKSCGIYLGAYSIEKLETEKPSYRGADYYIDLFRQKISSALMHDFDN
ncbi:MAG: DUF4131 domain-containing protein, partial [Clostridia bacterium]|nr:DUF4131 domain-containing protein [Clostridia bacterium]